MMHLPQQDTTSENQETFNFAASWETIKGVVLRRKLIILLTAVICVFLTVIYIFIFPPVYVASVKILVDEDKDNVKDDFYSQWSIFRKSEEIKTEAELLKLEPVIREVITKLDLKYEDVYHPFTKNVLDLWARSKMRKVYKSFKNHIIPPKKKKHNFTPQEQDLVQSIIDFKRGIQISSIQNSAVGQISVFAPSDRVAEIANTLVEVYLSHRVQRHRRDAMAAYDAITPLVKRAELALFNAQNELRDYADSNNIKFDFDKERSEVRLMAELEVKLKTISADLSVALARQKQIEKEFMKENKTDISVYGIQANSGKNEIKSKIVSFQMQLIDLRQKYQENAPEIIDIKAKIIQLENMLKETDDMVLNSKQEQINPVWQTLNNERSSLNIEIEELKTAQQEQRKIVKQYAGRLANVPDKQRRILDLSRHLSIAEKEYHILIDKQKQAHISGLSETQNIASMKIVEKAAIPEKPKRPNFKLYMLVALMVGFAMGVGAAFLSELMDDKIYCVKSMEQAFGEPVLSCIPLSVEKYPTPLKHKFHHRTDEIKNAPSKIVESVIFSEESHAEVNGDEWAKT